MKKVSERVSALRNYIYAKTKRGSSWRGALCDVMRQGQPLPVGQARIEYFQGFELERRRGGGGGTHSVTSRGRGTPSQSVRPA